MSRAAIKVGLLDYPQMAAIYPDLQGRAALVTGASSGIGLGIAQALLSQGMRLAIVRSRDEPVQRHRHVDDDLAHGCLLVLTRDRSVLRPSGIRCSTSSGRGDPI